MSKSVDDNSSLESFSIESPAPLYARVELDEVSLPALSGVIVPNKDGLDVVVDTTGDPGGANMDQYLEAATYGAWLWVNCMDRGVPVNMVKRKFLTVRSGRGRSWWAVETALRLLENGESNTRTGGEVVTVTLGPDDAAKELRTTLAMGADRAIHVVTDDKDIDSLAVVKVLQAIIEAEKPDLVLMGKQAVDGDANQVGQMLAGKLGWPQATFAATIEKVADGFVVGREVDGGVDINNIAQVVAAGAEIIVAGSAVFGAENPVKAIAQLIDAGTVWT